MSKPELLTKQADGTLYIDHPVQELLKAARELSSGELPALIGELERIKAIAWSRITSPASTQQHDELLGIDAAARRLGVSKDYLYRRHSELAFARREGRRLLFSALGIDQYIRQNRP